MWLLYLLVNDFGWAVVLFTLIVKAISFPLTLKQQKNMAFSQLFTPRVQEIQKKYRGNQQKMQEEMAKLQKEGYNPVGGCGPMILTMIILFGVIDVVYKPMTHMERFDSETITTIQELGRQVEYTTIILDNDEDLAVFLEYRGIAKPAGPRNAEVSEISNSQRKEIGEYIFNDLVAFTGSASEIGISDSARSAIRSVENRYRNLQRELHSVTQYARAPEAFEALASEDISKLERMKDNIIFLGFFNLGAIPHFTQPNALWLIGMLCFFFSVMQMAVQRYIQKKTVPNAANSGMMKAMLLMGPMFSLIIVFSVPAGAGLYWMVSYMFMIAQSIFIYKIYPPEKMREEAAARAKEKGGSIDVVAKVVDVDEDGKEVIVEEKVSDMSAKEQKEYYRKKLEAARKADLERYGDVPDIDLSQYDKPAGEPPESNDDQNNIRGEN
ncbi:MAG: membrane protein insertase YidC [Oscillospiraceae bacterium]|jgi:YidC/Oxa1 family membrane protein insertase|nr:membrane protein insertase YidC [Oscillospiraceae bacterium]